MNKELLKELNIDENLSLKDILEELENRQFECLERLENAKDERRNTLELKLSQINKEISDIKEQIKAVKSGIILDDETESNESVLNENKIDKKANSSDSKTEKISKQIETFKANEQKRQTKINERKMKSSEQAAKEVQSGLLTGGDSDITSSNNSNSELTNALLSYKKGDYNNAFKGFKKLAEEDDATAQYMLANMYHRGEGSSQNDERAVFWMKKAADGGFASAQLDYGILKLANNISNDNSSILEGLYYIGEAADKDDKQAMLKYIEVAKQLICGKSTYERAIGYCERLKSLTNDSYDAAKYEDAKKDIEVLIKDQSAKERKIKTSNYFSIFGAILSLLGGLYVLGGIHPVLWETNTALKFFPDAGRFLILPIKTIWIILTPIMNQNGLWGLELIVMGALFITAGDYSRKQRIAKAFETINIIGWIGIVIWHFAAFIKEGKSVFTALGWYIIVILLAYFIGKALGILLGKILKMR